MPIKKNFHESVTESNRAEIHVYYVFASAIEKIEIELRFV